MDNSDSPRPLNPFEKFVAAIAAVPKAEIDAVAQSDGARPKQAGKPGPKPRPAA
jgi:hypothetical protein